MKFTHNSFLVFFLVLCAGVASGQPPLVKKINYPGFTIPGEAFKEVCTLYRSHIIIERVFGDAVTLTERKEFSLTGSINGMLEKLKEEEVVVKDNNICDGPRTEITAYLPMESGANESLILYSTGGCSDPRKSREGSSSRQLRRMVGLFCPVTHKAIGSL